VTLWRHRLAVAIDALGTDSPLGRHLPVETATVQLPTGERLRVPTAAETLRLQAYLLLCRNAASDYVELAALAESVGEDNAALVLSGIDRYYSSRRRDRPWIATQLVRRLADPRPSGGTPEGDWSAVRRRCLTLAVAMLEEESV
jgi:RND superfamily putative drug exporter